MQQSLYLTKNIKVPSRVMIREVYRASFIYVLDDKPVASSMKVNLLAHLALYRYDKMPEKISL